MLPRFRRICSATNVRRAMGSSVRVSEARRFSNLAVKPGNAPFLVDTLARLWRLKAWPPDQAEAVSTAIVQILERVEHNHRSDISKTQTELQTSQDIDTELQKRAAKTEKLAKLLARNCPIS